MYFSFSLTSRQQQSWLVQVKYVVIHRKKVITYDRYDNFVVKKHLHSASVKKETIKLFVNLSLKIIFEEEKWYKKKLLSMNTGVL